MLRVLFISPKIFFNIIREYCIIRFLLGRSHTIKINFNGKELQGPNEHGFFYTSIEVFYWELYKKLKGCNHVLDLGGYLGESAVWLSLHNKKVTVVEPNPLNFNYLSNNISQHININGVEGAIIYRDKGKLYHAGGSFSAGGNITTKKTDIPIENVFIDTIRTNDIDGLKMDIEGGEYDIINFLQTSKGLQLKKGYIEFHNIVNNNMIIGDYIRYLLDNNYSLEYENIYGKEIQKNEFLGSNIAVLYFIKK